MKTPGQAAYEKWREIADRYSGGEDWERLRRNTQDDWQEIAQAASDAFAPCSMSTEDHPTHCQYFIG